MVGIKTTKGYETFETQRTTALNVGSKAVLLKE